LGWPFLPRSGIFNGQQQGEVIMDDRATAPAYNQPLGGNEMPRFAGPTTMMRLPAAATAQGLDACFVGVPMDIGASNRAGTRHGPRQIRAESVMLRPYNMATGAAPFESMQVADIGDVAINTFDLKKTVDLISQAYHEILSHDAIPLTLGGDHTLTYPILRAMAAKYGPVALIHVDAHADINDEMFGEKIAHGTPFRRAHEAGCLQDDKVFQIGLRGTGYGRDDFNWGRERGWTVIPAEACWYKSLAPLMQDIRARISTAPVYLSFDIDSLDPAFAPGTGTQEIGGLTIWQALELVRGCAGLNLVGCDLVEVSPPYDMAGTTALVAANLLYEMLCVLPKAQAAPLAKP
jgi:guanidinobutyrase